MAVNIRCRLGLHKWQNVGWSDKILCGETIAFGGDFIQRCERCPQWKKTNPRIGDYTYFTLENQNAEVKEKLLKAVQSREA